MEHYCETCDRGWESVEELEKHREEHVQCEVEGCSFSAAAKLVTVHFKLQHATGIFDRIIKSSNSGDIERWKEERRRNYPTKENIERKKMQKEEMVERGERMEVKTRRTKGSPYNQRHKDLKSVGNKREEIFQKGRRRRRKKQRKAEESTFTSSITLSEDDEREESSKMAEDSQVFSDDEWKEPRSEVTPVVGAVSNVLTALTSAYASDSEEDQEFENRAKKGKDELKTENQNQAVPKEVFNAVVDVQKTDKTDDEDDGPIEEIIQRDADDLPNIYSEKSRKFKSGKVTKKSQPLRCRPKKIFLPVRKKLSLLEKLLAPEIRQERNYILQCLRFIIQKNFLNPWKPVSK